MKPRRPSLRLFALTFADDVATYLAWEAFGLATRCSQRLEKAIERVEADEAKHGAPGFFIPEMPDLMGSVIGGVFTSRGGKA